MYPGQKTQPSQQSPSSTQSTRKLFNLNTILSTIINFAAYIILIFSAGLIIYLSFIQSLEFKIDWKTLGVFTGAAVLLSWINWSTFYKKHYEKVMSDDIDAAENNSYSIHSRYYNAIKDYDDTTLQQDIDKFNDEYTNKWLRGVERTLGFPIETTSKIEVDEEGNPVLEESTGKPKVIVVPGIKDLPYKTFKHITHKFLAWRVKNHWYPKSGYNTSMEVMSLLSFQESNLNKRHLKADKSFYIRKSITKFASSLLTVSVGASLIPEMITGEWWAAILKLAIAVGTLVAAVLGGSLNGIRGARLKLSNVEDVCGDLERWAKKKPILIPYKLPVDNTKLEQSQLDLDMLLPNKTSEVTFDIFNSTKISK